MKIADDESAIALNKAINELKIDAFDKIWRSRGLDPKITGHKSIEDLSWWFIAHTHEKIEKMIKEWEKKNPIIK
jgi:hypothetical protein